MTQQETKELTEAVLDLRAAAQELKWAVAHQDECHAACVRAEKRRAAAFEAHKAAGEEVSRLVEGRPRGTFGILRLFARR